MITILIPRIETGGVERNAIWLANNLIKKTNEEICFAYCSDERNLVKALDCRVNIKKYPTFRVPYVNNRVTDALSTLIFLIIRRDINRLICFQSGSIFLFVKLFRKVKIIIRLSNNPSSAEIENSWLRKISEKIKLLLLPYADEVIVISKAMATYYKDKINLNTTLIYNPLKEDIRGNIVSPKEKIRMNFVSVGRLEKQKNHIFLLRTFAKLKYAEKINFMLTIIGEGSLRESIENEIQRLQLEQNVKLIGYHPNAAKTLHNYSIYIQAPLYEGFGTSLIEAMSANLITISSNCESGPAEILEEGELGFLFEPGNTDQLISIIKQIYNNEHDIVQKLEKARCSLKRFSQAKIVQDYLKTIE